jgi:hypothetical protein
MLKAIQQHSVGHCVQQTFQSGYEKGGKYDLPKDFADIGTVYCRRP